MANRKKRKKLNNGILSIVLILLLIIMGIQVVNLRQNDTFNKDELYGLGKFFLKKVDKPKTKTAQLPEYAAVLDVPLINQMDSPQLFNGCEVASLAMVLQYEGIKVTKNELAEKITTVPLTYDNGQKGNPNMGFVGNMEDGPGLTVYHGPVLKLAQKFVGEKATDLTDSPFTDVLHQVSDGHPVWVITTTTFAPVTSFEQWDTPQGKIDITFNVHSVAITGYDAQYIYINDPYGHKNRKVDRVKFIEAWEQMGSQAIFIKK